MHSAVKCMTMGTETKALSEGRAKQLTLTIIYVYVLSNSSTPIPGKEVTTGYQVPTYSLSGHLMYTVKMRLSL